MEFPESLTADEGNLSIYYFTLADGDFLLPSAIREINSESGLISIMTSLEFKFGMPEGNFYSFQNTGYQHSDFGDYLATAHTDTDDGLQYVRIYDVLDTEVAYLGLLTLNYGYGPG